MAAVRHIIERPRVTQSVEVLLHGGVTRRVEQARARANGVEAQPDQADLGRAQALACDGRGRRRPSAHASATVVSGGELNSSCPPGSKVTRDPLGSVSVWPNRARTRSGGGA